MNEQNEDIKTDETPEVGTTHGLFKRLGPAAWLGAAWAVLPAAGGFAVLFNMEAISQVLDSPADAGPSDRLLRIGLYVGVFVVSAGFGFLPTYSQAILAGYVFKVAWGFPAALAGFAGASIIGFYVARRFGLERVEREIDANRKASAVRRALIGSGFWKTLGIVTLVRVPPNSPFALTNLVLSATGVPKRIYAIGTVVGMSPRTFAAVAIGSQIESWDDFHKPKWMVIGGIILTVVMLVVVGVIANKALAKVTAADDEAEDSGSTPDDAGAAP